ncbi:sulfate transporter CysZ [Ectothiorhodospiraceae bacterium BW-2]|nr:sulfate transporter CysZ [Ectothiorhodospiraceae bacterium BW-2]
MPFFHGPRYLLKGLQLVVQPGIRPYVILPLIINLLLFIGGTWLAMSQLEGVISQWLSGLPTWLQWLEGLLWLLALAVVLVLLYFTLTLVGTLIAAPFHALLSAAVERHYRRTLEGEELERPIWQELPHLLLEEWRKLRYYLARAIPLLLLMFIPGLALIASPLWFLFTAWMVGLTYLAYPFDNHHTPFAQQRHSLGNRRSSCFSYGLTTLLATLIPGINFLIMPIAVAGATALWLEQIAPQQEEEDVA